VHKSYQQVIQNLQQFWGFPAFREGQDKAVQSVLAGNDTLVLFPTGGGKSLVYQVPATVFEGLTLVISPLVALMQDQVSQLKARGVSATFINSTLPLFEVEQRLVNARNGMYKLLYCAPERLNTPLFQAELEEIRVDMVAVDEAHCISEWGHDFRPAYRTIRQGLAALPKTTRWLALTATATPEVKDDILASLEFENAVVVSGGFSRPNLKFWVVQTEDKRTKLVETIKRASKKGDGLIYGGTRKNCEYWANVFTQKGIPAEAYHAGLPADHRKDIQQRWISGDTALVVATNAFGMGIDKPNCRYVVHEEMPYSIEAYYQEAGRVGRDGADGFPVLLYRASDYKKLKSRLEESYPSRGDILKVYNAICDELELAVGSNMTGLKPVDFAKIKTRSGVSARIVTSAVRLLHQFGVIVLQQIVAPTITVQFSMSRELLASFKQNCENPQKAEFVDKVERLSGQTAFFEPQQVEEAVLLDKLQVNRNGLIKALNVLMYHDNVLVFKAEDQQSLIMVLEARSRELPIANQQVESYRKTLLNKLDAMHGYARTNECRERYLLMYFGQTEAKHCGRCDNCVRKETDGSYDTKMVQRVLNLLTTGVSETELIHHTKFHKKAVHQIINHLIREGLIEADATKPGHYSTPN
jgi:ATP-dependent DNA helicase RecQ